VPEVTNQRERGGQPESPRITSASQLLVRLTIALRRFMHNALRASRSVDGGVSSLLSYRCTMRSMVSRLASVLTLGFATFVAAGCATSTDEEVAESEEALTTTVNISCASVDQRFQSCRVESQQGKIVSARLVRQFSTAVCTQGTSWGFDDDSVWVDRGCRASFDVTVRKGPQVTKSVAARALPHRVRRDHELPARAPTLTGGVHGRHLVRSRGRHDLGQQRLPGELLRPRIPP
jgi:hypothetical protein